MHARVRVALANEHANSIKPIATLRLILGLHEEHALGSRHFEAKVKLRDAARVGTLDLVNRNDVLGLLLHVTHVAAQTNFVETPVASLASLRLVRVLVRLMHQPSLKNNFSLLKQFALLSLSRTRFGLVVASFVALETALLAFVALQKKNKCKKIIIINNNEERILL